jgi:hypothetical protein
LPFTKRKSSVNEFYNSERITPCEGNNAKQEKKSMINNSSYGSSKSGAKISKDKEMLSDK